MKAFLIFSAALVGALSMSSAASARSEMMCTMQYQPVCGAKQVQCVAAPCYPQYETYGNACMLGAADATFIHEGECTASETGPWKGGDAGYAPPAQCVAWFDGCNSCSKGPDGSAACTLRACEGTPAPGYCTKYEDAAPTPEPTPEPVAPIEGDVSGEAGTSVGTPEPVGFLAGLWQRVLGWFTWF